MKRIVYTRHDGGVDVCEPSQWCLDWLSNGGFWGKRSRTYLETMVAHSVAQGRQEWAARRFVQAMDEGGCTTAQAYAVIRDRDCGHKGSGFEVWEPSSLPGRWFRDAWRRSHNGGPIGIDIDRARRIQFTRITDAIAMADKARKTDMDRFDDPLDVPLGAIRDRLVKAQTPEDIRHIWPKELARP